MGWLSILLQNFKFYFKIYNVLIKLKPYYVLG